MDPHVPQGPDTATPRGLEISLQSTLDGGHAVTIKLTLSIESNSMGHVD